MRIVHVEDHFDPSAGYQINELLLASKNFDDDVYLLSSTDMSPFHKLYDSKMDEAYEKKTGVKIIRLKVKFRMSSRIIMENYSKIIEDLNPDLVYLHGIGDFKDLVLWRKKKPYKIVRDCHMSWVASRNRLRKLYYIFFRLFFANKINNTNKYEKVYALGLEEWEYLNRLGVNDEKIQLLPHGYSDETMYFDYSSRVSLRKHYNINENEILISYIGKFNMYKRPDLILKMVEQLLLYNNNLKINLLFIGSKEPKYMDSVFLPKYNQLRNRVNIILDDAKEYEELYKYFSTSDICIFPKETSLSSIHAQVCGCKVIMENHKSNSERVIDKSTLFEVDDLEGASNILMNLIENHNHDRPDFIKQLKHLEYKNQFNKIKENL